MHGKMLGAGVGFQIGCILRSLQAADHRHPHPARQIGVFPIGFHPASPARVAEDVDVRCPERQPLVPAGFTVGQRHAMLHARLVAYSRKHLIQKVIVERCRHADGLRKDRRATVARNPVQGFVPPVVGRDAQPFDGCAPVGHQRGFFFQRQARYQIRRPLLRAFVRIGIHLGPQILRCDGSQT